jgi:deoxycytidine triphosphate deaminase
MQLTGQETIKRGFVNPVCDESVRPAGYDVIIEEIIADGKRYKRGRTVKAQGMVVLISKETIKVPSGYVAYALPKTSLCQEGILTLNTGILDPGFDGPVSTVAINFNAESYTLKPGESFLRLVFHKLEGENSDCLDNCSVQTSRESYIQTRIEEAAEFPDTFLDVENIKRALVDDVQDKLIPKLTRNFAFVIAILGFVITLLVLGLNRYSEKVVFGRLDESTRMSESRESFQSSIAKIEAVVARLEGEIRGSNPDYITKIENDLEDLRRQLKEMGASSGELKQPSE